MKQLSQLLKEQEFLQSLFKAIPCGVLIVDRDRRIYAANDATRLIFRVDQEAIVFKRLGEALRCVNADISKKGCGYSRRCRHCEIRRVALEAIGGNRVARTKARVEIR
ncbi:MAG TPA: PAS domain-containing protein, partial [Desulfobacterales bacterium]|nr:PAS domain-containing protein [Desulfobacterales bacterium]